MRLLNFLRGYLCLTVSGAEPTRFLNRLAAMGVTFWQPVFTGPFTVQVYLYPHSLPRARQAAERCQCTVDGVRAFGFRAVFYGLKHRPVLVVGLMAAVLAGLWLPSRVWTIRVTGCESYHPQQILRALEEVGVGFGTPASRIDAQALETKLKLRLDRLEWFTINVTGMRAEAVIREREPAPAIVPVRTAANITAACPGVITQMQVYAGRARVLPGQTVQAGQLLVSGVIDHSVCTQYACALAEVYARTWRQQEALAPLTVLEKGEPTVQTAGFALILGKKRLNFIRNSRISGGVYDKIIETRQLSLPGGIVLPVWLVRETALTYAPTARELDAPATQARLEQQMRSALLGQMNAGQIHRVLSVTARPEAGFLRVGTTCECTEQIGRTRPIELLWNVSDTDDD